MATGQTVALNDALIERARQSAGHPGCVTNFAPGITDGQAFEAGYRDLWKI